MTVMSKHTLALQKEGRNVFIYLVERFLGLFKVLLLGCEGRIVGVSNTELESEGNEG